MRRILSGLLLPLSCVCVPAAAADWPPIPPAVWAIRSGDKGAVVLDKWIRYGPLNTEARVRLRIFGEAGLPAAVLPDSDQAWTVEGRTVQPDGRETRFDGAKDLVERSVKIGSREGQQHTLVPPGVTSDCVVEYHYRFDPHNHDPKFRALRLEGGDIRLGMSGSQVVIPVLEAYPVVHKVVEITNATVLGVSLLCPPDLRPAHQGMGDLEVYDFHDLPPLEPQPYSLQGAFLPRFVCFRQPPGVPRVETRGPEVYWKTMVEKVWKPLYGDLLKTGKAYREWSGALREGVAGDPWAQAREISLRLAERMRDLSQLGDAERSALGGKEARAQINPWDLEACVKRGETAAGGMHLLLYRLLCDQGLAPVLLFTMDRQEQAFHYELPNIYQFTSAILGVPGAGGALRWFEPGRRFLPPGLAAASYQGARGLLVDLRDGSFRACAPELQEAGENTSRYEFELELGDVETIHLRAAFTGLPDYEVRRAYGFLPGEERGRALKEKLEKAQGDFTVTLAEVAHATEIRQPTALKAEGSCPLEEGRSRSFKPFPGLADPLVLPAAWPAQRSYPIVLPFRHEFTAVSRFRIPAGWKLRDEPDFARENLFGKVTWQVRPGAGPDLVAEVTYTLTVKTPLAPETADRPLRDFLGWMEAATRRTLALERL